MSWWLGVAVAAAAYAVLSVPLVTHQGVNWDEQTDLDIAASYVNGPRALFIGSRVEPNQTRLPMYSFALLTLSGIESSLTGARMVSVALGLSTVIATAWLGALLLGRRTGLIAACVLATSPYYLAYSSLGLTEGSVFIATATTWTVLAAVAFAARPTWPRCAVLGVALGLCVSAKLSGVALVPAVTLATLLPSALGALRSGTSSVWREALPWLGAAAAFACWLLVQLVGTGAVAAWLTDWLPWPLQRGYVRYAAVVAGWTSLIAWSWNARGRPTSASGRMVLPLLLAGLTFFVVPPVHTTDRALFAGMWQEAIGSGEGVDPGLDAVFLSEAAVFLFLVVLMKPGIGVGAAIWIGLGRAITQLRERSELRLLVATIVCYIAFLLVLPLAQTHYMMAVFPLLVLLGVDAFVNFARARPRFAATFAMFAVILLVRDYRLSYPDLNLNGYQWLGTRYLAGRSTLGYRGVAQVGEDGVEQILRWSEGEIESDATVVAYLPAGHIVRAILPNPAFRLVNGMRHPDAIDAADYVLTCLNGDIAGGHGTDNPQGSPFKYSFYDRSRLEREFEPVFSVRRAFAIEVATVWKRL